MGHNAVKVAIGFVLISVLTLGVVANCEQEPRRGAGDINGSSSD